LPEEQATTLFIDPATQVDRGLYSRLSDVGFRRSGAHLYRPHCGSCSACTPVRVLVAKFQANRSQRRILARNDDLVVRQLATIDTPDIYQLYSDYIEVRHSDGDMYPPSEEQYTSFLTSQWGCTRYMGFFLDEKLIAVAVTDHMDHGLSAIYTFYKADLNSRSLGTFAVLWQILEAKRLALPHVYLGYWIAESRKMAYKSNFQPLEMLRDGHWVESIR
jgi:arginine-tRNA-protein transferase